MHVTNTYAYVFQTPLQTAFFSVMNKTLDYYFPAASLMPGQAPPIILVEPFEGYEEYYPPFIVVFDTNDRIQFTPTSEDLYGKTFYFKFVVKAPGAQVGVGFSYYCSVQVAKNEAEVFVL